jgi:two-component system chemotaxis response regulator CheY
MGKRLLIVDANTVAAENLKSRLAGVAEVQVASDVAALDLALGATWDCIVCDAGLGALEGNSLWTRLRARERPVYLYTDRSELVEGGAWKGPGLAGAFARTQRADLMMAVEQALQGPAAAGAGGLAPAFLLVEDSATVRQFVKAVLNQAYPGSEMIEADDGRAALAAMKSSRISLIVTDLQMPGMDGLSFVQLLRNNAVLKKKPVIVLSGAVTDDARESLGHLEKVQILAKPATPDMLVGAVKSLLS